MLDYGEAFIFRYSNVYNDSNYDCYCTSVQEADTRRELTLEEKLALDERTCRDLKVHGPILDIDFYTDKYGELYIPMADKYERDSEVDIEIFHYDYPKDKLAKLLAELV